MILIRLLIFIFFSYCLIVNGTFDWTDCGTAKICILDAKCIVPTWTGMMVTDSDKLKDNPECNHAVLIRPVNLKKWEVEMADNTTTMQDGIVLYRGTTELVSCKDNEVQSKTDRITVSGGNFKDDIGGGVHCIFNISSVNGSISDTMNSFGQSYFFNTLEFDFLIYQMTKFTHCSEDYDCGNDEVCSFPNKTGSCEQEFEKLYTNGDGKWTKLTNPVKCESGLFKINGKLQSVNAQIKCARKKCHVCAKPSNTDGLFVSAVRPDDCVQIKCKNTNKMLIDGSILHKSNHLNCSSSHHLLWDVGTTPRKISNVICINKVICNALIPIHSKCDGKESCTTVNLSNVTRPSCDEGVLTYVDSSSNNATALSSIVCDENSGTWTLNDTRGNSVAIGNSILLQCIVAPPEVSTAKNEAGPSYMLIICIAVPVIVLILIVLAVVCWCRRRKAKAAGDTTPTKTGEEKKIQGTSLSTKTDEQKKTNPVVKAEDKKTSAIQPPDNAVNGSSSLLPEAAAVSPTDFSARAPDDETKVPNGKKSKKSNTMTTNSKKKKDPIEAEPTMSSDAVETDAAAPDDSKIQTTVLASNGKKSKKSSTMTTNSKKKKAPIEAEPINKPSDEAENAAASSDDPDDPKIQTTVKVSRKNKTKIEKKKTRLSKMSSTKKDVPKTKRSDSKEKKAPLEAEPTLDKPPDVTDAAASDDSKIQTTVMKERTKKNKEKEEEDRKSNGNKKSSTSTAKNGNASTSKSSASSAVKKRNSRPEEFPRSYVAEEPSDDGKRVYEIDVGCEGVDAEIDSIMDKLETIVLTEDGKIEFLENEIEFTVKQVTYICKQVRDVLRKGDSLPLVPLPCVIAGDLHGQICDTTILHVAVVFANGHASAAIRNLNQLALTVDSKWGLKKYHDLIGIFRTMNKEGIPGHFCRRYIFMGDYVDRGAHSLEVLLILYILKTRQPKEFTLLRGNHEQLGQNKTCGFENELTKRYKNPEDFRTVFDAILDTFEYLPLAAIAGDCFLAVHGGISDKVFSREDLKIPLPSVTDDSEVCIRTDLLWSDPDPEVTRFKYNSTRKVAWFFGQEAVEDFCKKIRVNKIFRGHQIVPEGVAETLGGRVITVFTASAFQPDTVHQGGFVYVGRTPKEDKIYRYDGVELTKEQRARVRNVKGLKDSDEDTVADVEDPKEDAKERPKEDPNEEPKPAP